MAACSRRTSLRVAALLLGAFALLAIGGLPSTDAALASFNGVRSCVPFTIFVKPPIAGAAGNGTVTIAADASVAAAILTTVEAGILSISVVKGFSTNRTINVTIIASSATKFTTVDHQGTGDVVLAPGFNVGNLTLKTSTGRIYVSEVTAARVKATASGNSKVKVTGSIGSADLQATGNANIIVLGVRAPGQVKIKTDDVGRTYVWGTSAMKLTGSADNMSEVYYNNGTCSLGEPSIFGNPCNKLKNNNTIPNFSSVFNCGLVISGKSSCNSAASVKEWSVRKLLSSFGSKCVDVPKPAPLV